MNWHVGLLIVQRGSPSVRSESQVLLCTCYFKVDALQSGCTFPTCRWCFWWRELWSGTRPAAAWCSSRCPRGRRSRSSWTTSSLSGQSGNHNLFNRALHPLQGAREDGGTGIQAHHTSLGSHSYWKMRPSAVYCSPDHTHQSTHKTHGIGPPPCPHSSDRTSPVPPCPSLLAWHPAAAWAWWSPTSF